MTKQERGINNQYMKKRKLMTNKTQVCKGGARAERQQNRANRQENKLNEQAETPERTNNKKAKTRKHLDQTHKIN